jgi:putative polyketide hydroxylase
MERHVPVLIAGGGTVGLSAALFLAHHGVSALLVERQDAPSIHPRATGVGPRTVEFLREVGIADEVDAVAVDMSSGGMGKIGAVTLAGADLAAEPPVPRQTVERFGAVSPQVLRGTCPQSRLDAVLLRAAVERGADVRYGTRLKAFRQEEGGVAVDLEGETVRADYLIAADGARSGVRTALGIGTTGPGDLGRQKLNILFRADLGRYTGGRSFVTCNITNPESPGMLVTVDNATEWIFHVDSDVPLPFARCAELVRLAVGDPGLDVEVLSALPWRVRGLLADRFRDGRVFLVGDAAHAVPPLGAFGMNTGVADAHNLAWKLALVLSGAAGPSMLDTYEPERRPVAAMTLEQALLRLGDPRLHWTPDPLGRELRAAAGALHAPVVQLGYRYDSAAVVDPDPRLPSTEDVALDLDGTPGSRLPHRWVSPGVSTLDLIGSRFTVLSGADAWLRAASTLGVAAHRIALDGWPAAVGTGVDGAVLVRPDGFVAWRSGGVGADPVGELTSALSRVRGLAYVS